MDGKTMKVLQQKLVALGYDVGKMTVFSAPKHEGCARSAKTAWPARGCLADERLTFAALELNVVFCHMTAYYHACARPLHNAASIRVRPVPDEGRAGASSWCHLSGCFANFWCARSFASSIQEAAHSRNQASAFQINRNELTNTLFLHRHAKQSIHPRHCHRMVRDDQAGICAPTHFIEHITKTCDICIVKWGVDLVKHTDRCWICKGRPQRSEQVL